MSRLDLGDIKAKMNEINMQNTNNNNSLSHSQLSYLE